MLAFLIAGLFVLNLLFGIYLNFKLEKKRKSLQNFRNREDNFMSDPWDYLVKNLFTYVFIKASTSYGDMITEMENFVVKYEKKDIFYTYTVFNAKTKKSYNYFETLRPPEEIKMIFDFSRRIALKNYEKKQPNEDIAEEILASPLCNEESLKKYFKMLYEYFGEDFQENSIVLKREKIESNVYFFCRN